MTAEELKNVAGFKAVDAEGNELGVVSLSDIVSAVKQELQPSGVARASVAALSEVSAQAATDTYEDQLPQKTDVTWIRGLDESGNPILISKQSLVSVAEELLQSYKSVVYVAYYDHNNNIVCTPWENWNTGRSGALGVVIIEGSKRLLVAIDEATLYWSSKTGSGGATTTTSKDTADGDYKGRSNTSEIVSSSSFSSDGSGYAPGYCHAYSKGNKAAGSWWLPSLGELGMIWKYFEPINAALARISGATQLSVVPYWSSTEHSASNAWNMNMGNGGRWHYSKATYQYRVRPVSEF